MTIDIKLGSEPDATKVGLLNPLAIQGAIDMGTYSQILLIGGGVVYTDIMLPDIKKAIIEAEGDRWGMNVNSGGKTEIKNFPVIQVGEHKFQLYIQTYTDIEGKVSQYLTLEANFLVENDALKTVIEMANGVENMRDYARDKYKTCIYIGSMFDPETIRADVEAKIKYFFED